LTRQASKLETEKDSEHKAKIKEVNGLLFTPDNFLGALKQAEIADKTPTVGRQTEKVLK
jgi:hypothetical protein